MKKTFPAILAAQLMTAILVAGMFIFGDDVLVGQASAAEPQASALQFVWNLPAQTCVS